MIIVGQNVLAAAADKRSEATYDDADAVLHEAAKIQEHLAAQDKVLDALINKVQALSPSAPRLLEGNADYRPQVPGRRAVHDQVLNAVLAAKYGRPTGQRGCPDRAGPCHSAGRTRHRRGDTESVLYGGPGPRIEGAVDGGPGDIGEAKVAAAGVGPQPGESLGQIDVSAF